MRKILLFVLLLLSCVCEMKAEPAPSFPVKYTQPDGMVLTLVQRGDERISWAETTDGYKILSNGNGGWEYAVTDSSGDLKLSGVLAHDAANRNANELILLGGMAKKAFFSAKQITAIKAANATGLGDDDATATTGMKKVSNSNINSGLTPTTGLQKLFSPSGTKKLLMILVEFSDKSLRYSQADFSNLMNAPGYNQNGAQGSVRDYFLEASYGKFDVTTDVIGPYKVSNTHDYYGADIDGIKDKRYAEMVTEAVAQADAAGVDFSKYDSDGDKIVDGVYVIFQGWSQAHSGIENDIWSKAGSISYTATNATSAGIKIQSFSCSNELLYESSDHLGLATIGVICHEFGHVCGAPDYYDTDYGTGGQYQGTGDWDVMCGGNNNGTTAILSGNTPAHFNPYTKMRFGWLTPVELTTSSAGRYTLPDIMNNAQVYKVNTPNTAGEYFLLENRQQTGFNAAIPGHGLMIYHKDSRPYMRGEAGNDKTHPQSLYPVCANSTVAIPTSDPASYGTVNSASCPFPGGLVKRSFVDADVPSAKSWAGEDTGLPITNITENADHTISFNFLSCINVTSLADFGKLSPNATSAEQSFTVTGSALSSDIVITPPAGFEISLTSGSGFVGSTSSLTIPKSGGTVAATTVYVRFKPLALQVYSDNINLVSGEITQIVPVTGQGNGAYWTGATSTEWNLASNWASGSIPTSTIDVIIPSTGVGVNASTGTTNWPVISTASAVCQDITIQSGAVVMMSGSTSMLSVSGNWSNSGSFVPESGTVVFNGTNDLQTIAGTSTSTFNILKVEKGARSRILEATSLIALSGATNPLVLTSGTFKLSSASTIKPFTSSPTISSTWGLWNNGGIINGGDFSLTLNGGLLRLSSGTINVGTGSGNSITYLNNGTLIVEGGALNVSGRISPNSGTSTGSYTQSGGVVTVTTAGSTSTTRAPFELNAVVPFTMSGGSIVVQKASSNATADVIISSTTNNVTGGTIQVGNSTTSASPVIRINSTAPIYNLLVNADGTPSVKLLAGLTVKNNVTIGSGAIIDLNTQNLSVGGIWTNNGGTLTTTPTGTVTFNGSSAQSIAGSAGTIFNNVVLNNSNGLALNGVDATVNGALTFTTGVVTTGSNKLIIPASGSVLRTSGHVKGNLQMNVATGANVIRSFEIGDATEANYSPVTVTFANVSTAGNLIAATGAGDHTAIGSSKINPDKSVNRYWNLTNDGIIFDNYNGLFSFVATDLDANVTASNLIAGKYFNSGWLYPVVILAPLSVRATGLTSFGDFQFGEDKGVATALSGDAIDNLINIYANAMNHIVVDCGISGDVSGLVKVYNAVGGVVCSRAISQSITEIDAQLSSGVYLVAVQTAQKSVVKKVIIR